MKITTDKKDRGVIVRLDGELDYHSYKGFEDVMYKLIDEKTGPIVLDLEAVVHIDSMGLGSITKLWKNSHKEELDFILAAVPANIGKMLKLINLDGRIPVIETVDAAFA